MVFVCCAIGVASGQSMRIHGVRCLTICLRSSGTQIEPEGWWHPNSTTTLFSTLNISSLVKLLIMFEQGAHAFRAILVWVGEI